MNISGLNVIKLQQFDGTNFSNWKYRVGILLDEKGLRKYIDENLDDILTAAGDDNRDKVKLEEKKCVSILVQSIHDSQLEYVREKKKAKEMYDALCGIFERKCIATQLLLRKQLLMMKYQESDGISEHFFTSGGNSSVKSSEPGAMSAKRKSKEMVCYHCKKPGHKKSQCFLRKREINAKGGKESANKASNDNQAESMSAIVNEQTKTCIDKSTVCSAQAAQCGADSSKITFVLDSGATQHMVNNKRYFGKLHSIEEIEIAVAKRNQCISAKQ